MRRKSRRTSTQTSPRRSRSTLERVNKAVRARIRTRRRRDWKSNGRSLATTSCHTMIEQWTRTRANEWPRTGHEDRSECVCVGIISRRSAAHESGDSARAAGFHFLYIARDILRQQRSQYRRDNAYHTKQPLTTLDEIAQNVIRL